MPRPLRLTLIVALLGLALLYWLSWFGRGGPLPASSRVIRLGPQNDFAAAERLAIAKISAALRDEPNVQFVEARWSDSYLFGFAAGHQWTVDYDRRSLELQEFNLEDGPHERWSLVPESVMQVMASRGFDSALLISSGSRSHLP